jgi:tyrosine-specific transport protein
MFVIMGALPAEGDFGLIHILKSGEATSGLIEAIQKYLNIQSITNISGFFVSICVLTSFLGVSLALSDFFVDALKLPKTRPGRFKKCLFTYVPPLVIVIFFPKIFVIALSYAGLFVIIQQIILPVVIIWKGRYKLDIAKGYRVPGGKTGLCLLLAAGIIVFVICALGCLNFISITAV